MPSSLSFSAWPISIVSSSRFLYQLHFPSQISSPNKALRTLISSPFTFRRDNLRCNSSSISAKPSSQFRKNQIDKTEDQKLIALRQLFSNPGIGIDAYVIPSQDAHQSEFIADCYTRRAYISGFTGSAGTAVVTIEKAALWTDGRYFLQAEKQLNSNWTLMRAGSSGVPTASEWLNEVLPNGSKVGIDPFLFSFDAAEELKYSLSLKNNELIYLYNANLVDEIWGDHRPKPPTKPIRVHEISLAGVHSRTKLANVRSKLVESNAYAVILTMLDEIAWLLNLRGGDIPHSPVMYAYLIVKREGAMLFVDDSKVTMEVKSYLNDINVKLVPYDQVLTEIENLACQGDELWFDSSSVNAAIVSTYKTASDKRCEKLENKENNGGIALGPCGVYKASPISLEKSIKNNAELEGMRHSHLRDAAALAHFWAWLEEEISNNATISEVEAADKLLEFRSKQDGFLETSFDTISGSGANGAIIHYSAQPGACSTIDPKKLFLLDSGGQYIDGTTDITRTSHFGEPTPREKECFTRVLQGHISLDQAVFPENTPGFVLDAFARSSLWKIGLDYRHGTGHGVGAALNVHEGPQSISFRFGNTTPLQKGMIVSNEPGYYEDYSFGIRIENLLYVKEVETPNRFGGISYLGFEKLTFFPIQTKMMEKSLLSASEVSWVNEYHAQVWEKVSPLLDGSPRQWLWNNTRPVSK